MVQETVKFRCHDELKQNKAQEIANHSRMHKSTVRIKYKNSIIDASSPLTILGAFIKDNEDIVIECHGEDENETLRDVVKVATAC